MDKKIIVVLFSALLLAHFAVAAVNIFYDATVQVQLEKSELTPGETLEAKITIGNPHEFPIIEGFLVVEAITGNEIRYPSQASDEGTMFYEEIIENVNVPARQKIDVNFSYELPGDLKEGIYALNIYFKTKITPIQGAPSILFNPKPKTFLVAGNGGEFPELNIVRTRTNFNGSLGPVGAFVEPGQALEGEIFIENLSTKNMADLELFVALCEWDDTSCGSFDTEKTVPIGAIAAGQTERASVSFDAPQLPGAYAIRLELRERGGRMVSLYRNRAIVEGGTAKIRKLTINKPLFAEGDELTLDILVGPSPDHKNYPDFENFELEVSIDDLKGATKLGDSISIPLIRAMIPGTVDSDYFDEHFSFTLPSALDYFRACAKIVKDSIVYDEHCYTVDGQEFIVEVLPKYELAVEWGYSDADRELSITACATIDGEAADINANYYIANRKLNETIMEEPLLGTGCIEKETVLLYGEYLLIVNDFTGRTQKSFELKLEGGGNGIVQPPRKNCAELGGTPCMENEMCRGSFISAPDTARCCSMECIAQDPRPQFDAMGAFLILLAIVMALLVIVFVSGIIKKGVSEDG